MSDQSLSSLANAALGALITAQRHVADLIHACGGQSANTTEPWTTRQAAAEHAAVSLDTLDRWISDGLLPAGGSGRLIRVRLSDVDNALRAMRVEDVGLEPEAAAAQMLSELEEEKRNA